MCVDVSGLKVKPPSAYYPGGLCSYYQHEYEEVMAQHSKATWRRRLRAWIVRARIAYLR